jgi:hypothetical protein
MLIVDGVYYKPPAKYLDKICNVSKKCYRPGDKVYMRLRVTKSRNIFGTARYSLVNDDDKLSLFYAERGTRIGQGVWDVFIPIEKMPESAYPGRWHLEGLISYPVNHFRTLFYELKSESFIILDKDAEEVPNECK